MPSHHGLLASHQRGGATGNAHAHGGHCRVLPIAATTPTRSNKLLVHRHRRGGRGLLGLERREGRRGEGELLRVASGGCLGGVHVRYLRVATSVMVLLRLRCVLLLLLRRVLLLLLVVLRVLLLLVVLLRVEVLAVLLHGHHLLRVLGTASGATAGLLVLGMMLRVVHAWGRETTIQSNEKTTVCECLR